MEGKTVISAKNLTKTYRLYDAREDRVKETFHPFRKKYHRPFNALQNITFDVKKGDTFGIVGKNGSGKSTLLQLICGVLHPTSGELYIDGKVSALLELGTGFNPEFTGRENVFINGSIIGLSRREIEQKLDRILAFADIGSFIDQPVKTYSSGMYVRLAFAIAINVDPDILVVDEALAVGDIYFQHKCITRMRDLIRAGCTLVFVSHDISAVKSLCRKALFLDNGEMVCIGEAEKVSNRYYNWLIDQENMHVAEPEPEADASGPGENHETTAPHQEIDTGGAAAGIDADKQGAVHDTVSEGEGMNGRSGRNPVFSPSSEFVERVADYRSGTGAARVHNVQLVNSEGREIASCRHGDEIGVRVHLKFYKDLQNTNVGFLVKDRHGLELIGTNLFVESLLIAGKKAGDTVMVEFTFENILKDGTYSLTIAVGESDERGRYNIQTYDWIDNACVFRVETPVDKHISSSLVAIPVKIDIVG